jgi:hypothetical protein
VSHGNCRGKSGCTVYKYWWGREGRC